MLVLCTRRHFDNRGVLEIFIKNRFAASAFNAC